MNQARYADDSTEIQWDCIRKNITSGTTEYSKLARYINRKLKTANDDWYSALFEKIERLERNHQRKVNLLTTKKQLAQNDGACINIDKVLCCSRKTRYFKDGQITSTSCIKITLEETNAPH